MKSKKPKRILSDTMHGRLLPWYYCGRPRKIRTALKKLMKSSEYRITLRALAISAGVTRLTASQWLTGEKIPTNNEIRDISKAFCYRRFGLVEARYRLPLQAELQNIANHERNK